MNITEIENGLMEIIKNELGISIPEQADSTVTLEELGMDSIATMAMWVYAEERFSYETDEDALIGDQFRNINDIAKYIHSKVTNKEE